MVLDDSRCGSSSEENHAIGEGAGDAGGGGGYHKF